MIDYAQRRIWQRYRQQNGLDDNALDLTRHPLSHRMPEIAVLACLIPQDPLSPVLDFNSGLDLAIPKGLEGQASGMHGAVFSQTVVTGGHLLRESNDGAEGVPRAVAGVARNGGALAAVGSEAVEKQGSTSFVRLGVITATVRVAMQAQEAVGQFKEGAGVNSGPFELIVALPDATGMHVTACADGWDAARHCVCSDASPLARMEIEEFLTGRDGMGTMLGQAMRRIVNIFGTTDPLFANGKSDGSQVQRNY